MSWHIILFTYLFIQPAEQKRFFIEGTAQGTTYHVTYYAEENIVTRKQLDSLFTVLDNSLSIYKHHSVISRFNKHRKGLKADQHLATVVRRSQEVWKDTEGIFDITVQPLVKAWGFGVNNVKEYPDSAAISSLLPCVGTEKIKLKNLKLKKEKKCVTIDVNGIAQGYSVDVIAGYLEKKGLSDFIVEVGGEIRVKGKKPDGGKMKIGIEAPGSEKHNDLIMQKIISLDDGAVTTSGNYRKFHESNGKRINHIINPRTGYPIENELISVTVIAKDAMTADAYDNALLAMGLKKALDFVEARKDLSAFFIYRDENGKVTDTCSSRFTAYLE